MIRLGLVAAAATTLFGVSTAAPTASNGVVTPAAAQAYFPRVPCTNERQLFDTESDLQKLVTEFVDLHDSYADPVVEVTDAVVLFQMRKISESFLKVVDSLRLIICYGLCVEACSFGGAEAPTTFWIDHFVNQVHKNVDVLSNSLSWRAQVRDFMHESWRGKLISPEKDED